MICDKCRKRFAGEWVPTDRYPSYEIKERSGFVVFADINLCQGCSQLFKEWLMEEPEEEEDFGR